MYQKKVEILYIQAENIREFYSNFEILFRIIYNYVDLLLHMIELFFILNVDLFLSSINMKVLIKFQSFSLRSRRWTTGGCIKKVSCREIICWSTIQSFFCKNLFLFEWSLLWTKYGRFHQQFRSHCEWVIFFLSELKEKTFST